MLRRALKAAAYVRSPVRTFVMIHPVRALKMGVAYLIVKRALEMRRSG